MPVARQVIVEELVSQGLLTPAQVASAQETSTATRRPILKVLTEKGFITESVVYRTVANAAKMPFVDLDNVQVDPTASAKLNGEWARRLHALPYEWEGRTLHVAVDDPANLTLRDDLRRLTGTDPQLHLAPPNALLARIGQVYRTEEEIGDLNEALVTEITDVVEESGAGEGEEDAPIVKYVNLLISQAVADRASDIHIEPTETELQVRYRIDGVLQQQMSSNRSISAGVVSRVKIMASMDIAERRVPQDGRMTVNVQGRKIDLRVSTLPTVYGEKAVLRIMDNSATPVDLNSLGLSDRHQSIYKEMYAKPHGLILVTGPTGSGKSTTLYATLTAVRRPGINIVTVEDPVEQRIAGVSQMQINAKTGLTFAVALRSILRADPDVILVGEIRDRETAQIAIEAALTGHLVLASLHTNDAPSAVTRLVEMGIEPFLVGSALSMVVAQRLVRRLCERCKEAYTPTEDELNDLRINWHGEEPPKIYRKKGCSFCANTGYRGRLAVHEMMQMDDELERMTSTGAHTDELRNEAISKGMEEIRQDGWHKVLQGITTIEEVLRVLG